MNIYKVQLTDLEKLSPEIILNDTVTYIPLNHIEFRAEEKNLDRLWHLNRYDFPLSDAEFLNYFTHQQAWRTFLDSDENLGCFIEENIAAQINYQEIHNAIDLLDDDWDVFFPYNRFGKNKEISKHSLKLLNPNTREMIEKEPYFLGLCWGSSIYFLSKKGAKRLLEIKDIKQRVEDEMFYQSTNDNLEIYFESFDGFDVEAHPCFLPQERLRNINHAVLNYNTWEPEMKNIAKEMLAIFGEIGKKNNIDLILQGGSHLGYVRHGGIMPWDDDIDIGIEEHHIENFKKIISTYHGIHIKPFIEYPTNTVYYKIWSDNGSKIDRFEWTFPFIDLWLYNCIDKDYVFKNGIICPNSNIHPAVEIDFEGACLKIPYNSLECLDSRYIDWRRTIRIYPYSHKEERSRPHQLKTAITVDHHGRIIIA
jgi:GR25 family glycosyltransferase involved in LPS biosynthesis